MKRRLVIAMAAVAAGAGVVVPAVGLATADDISGGACTELDRAIDYHAWMAGTTDGAGRPTPDAVGSQRYLYTLYNWYHQRNCNFALGKDRPTFPPCYLSISNLDCTNHHWFPGSPQPKKPVLE